MINNPRKMQEIPAQQVFLETDKIFKHFLFHFLEIKINNVNIKTLNS